MVNGSVKKKFLVCGSGSIGIRHIENLLLLKQDVYVWQERKNHSKKFKIKFPKIKIIKSLDKAINSSDAVIIANSTHKHVKVLKKTLKHDKNIYIEKPISNNMKYIKKLLPLTKNKIIEVGYQLRNHPNLIFLKKILTNKKLKVYSYRFVMGHDLRLWRKNHDYKNSYTSDLKKGGGALLELIHQIDLALWFFGPIKKIVGERSKVSDLKIKADDLTNLIIVHKNGIAGQIQLDMVSPIYRCEAEILTQKNIFTWKYNKGIILKENSKKKTVIHKVNKSFNRNSLFVDSMKNFILRINNKNKSPTCNFKDGLSSLIAVDKIKKNYLKKFK